MNKETYVEVNRTSQYINKMRRFSVLIDGVEAGKIKDGGRLRIDLQPGEHVIQVKINWCTSQTVRFTLDEGEVLKFRCGSPVHGWKMFFALFYVLAAPEKYSFIEQE
ncbi:hypothetical protein ACH95_18935 [Bacillus glycinifermentans]|uniref:DUF2846 domain-containing protein n=1 Tax=Bacillus glycinifermentans TaxID=1664069 RepID=A0A0J6EE22_9BACI|nr:hypothetical protein [Bacillus glycinifermentans]ATH94106.1 hypothetical protein COP00_17060 [Bacillus glycinifermentans]KMM55605.1 hypothetical protein ACH95_18935 [Bacillus glycinifermentans]KRT94538.1 hypothetical protein AB447_214515 [Bacillus glycinifermentans]MEC0485986.1 hypothetical protein [Bacillus glycinifermentans]MEC0496451.1 hypothetical protein [Bacillus glycinifermentans]